MWLDEHSLCRRLVRIFPMGALIFRNGGLLNFIHVQMRGSLIFVMKAGNVKESSAILRQPVVLWDEARDHHISFFYICDLVYYHNYLMTELAFVQLVTGSRLGKLELRHGKSTYSYQYLGRSRFAGAHILPCPFSQG